MIVAAVAGAGKQEVAKHSLCDFNFFGWLEIKRNYHSADVKTACSLSSEQKNIYKEDLRRKTI